MKNLHVDVTQEAIDNAEHMKICNCPISRSINRHLTDGPYPLIELASVHLKDGHLTLTERFDGRISHTVFRFKLPAPAQEFVEKWDARQPVEPFEFDLTLKEKGPGLIGSTL